MNEKYIINFSSLDSLKEKFENDKKNFTNSSYSTFSSSYVKKCSDYNIQQMSNQLDKLYLKIKKSYEKMDKWLIEYINNTKGIEAKLSNKSGYSQISDSPLISQINNIKKLPTVTYDVKSSFNVKKSNNNAFSSTLETRNKVTTPNNQSINKTTKTKTGNNKIDVDKKLYSDEYIENEFKKEANQKIMSQLAPKLNTGSTNSSASASQTIKKAAVTENKLSDEEFARVRNKSTSSFTTTLETRSNVMAAPKTQIGLEKKKFIVYGTKDGLSIECDNEAYAKARMEKELEEMAMKCSGNLYNSATSALASSVINGAGNYSDSKTPINLNNKDIKLSEEDLKLFEQAQGHSKIDVASATAVFGTSIGEGVALFGEGVYDSALTTLTSGFKSGFYIKANGETTDSFTEWLEDTKNEVESLGFEFEYIDDGYFSKYCPKEKLIKEIKTEHVKDFFDSFYETNSIGKSLKDSSGAAFDITRGVGNGLGYVAPAIAATVVTGGAGASSVVASAMGAGVTMTSSFGSHVEEALNNGASLESAKGIGAAGAMIDAAQFFAGANVNAVSTKVFSSIANPFVKSALISATNVTFDSIDGATSTFVDPFLQSFYAKGYVDSKTGKYVEFDKNASYFEKFGKMFENTGGWSSVLSNSLLAGALSAISEGIDLPSKLNSSKNETNLNIKNSNMADNNNLKSIEKNTDINLKNKPTVKAKITEISNKIESKAITIFARLKSNIDKYSYKSTNYFEGLNDEIRKNGLYHFTGEKNLDSIINSGKIKGSDIISSYGNSKSFFFYGVPDVGAYATNLDKLPLKTTAVKIQPDDSIINSSKLKVRYKADAAISYDGSFIASPSTKMEKVYFVLTEENGKYSYKAVSEDIYRNYENTQMGKELNKKISDKSFVNKIKNDYLYETAIKETNAKIFDSKKVNNEFSKFLNQIDFNKNNLIESIIKNIPVDADDITKMRAIYLKLNQSVTYSDSFFTSNYFRLHTNSESFLSEVKGWYYKKTDVSNVVNSNVVCSDWSRMYSELLEMSGIDKNRISIRTTTNAELTHNYVVVDFGDKVLIADGTENIIGRTDLANSKYGLQTGGFIIASKDEFYSGLNQQGYKKTVEELSAKSQLSINGKDISEVDKEIGYSESQYNKDFNDLISTYSSTTSNSQQKVDTFMKVFNSKNESAIEAYPVLQNYASKIFGRDTKVQISITDNNSMVDIVMYREGNEIMYLVKYGNGDFQLRENIDDINILKTISVYP